MKKNKNIVDASLREERLICGLFSRKHGAQFIASGIGHVHSTLFGARDSCVQATKKAINTDKIPTYSWEQSESCTTLPLKNSNERTKVIQEIMVKAGAEGKKRLEDKLSLVLEELLSNGFYHAYFVNGKSKYERTKAACLSENEILTLNYAFTPEGVWLEVSDQGGNLTFDTVASSLSRCYAKSEMQILDKESGAGLGIYIVLEAVAHLKITVEPGVKTIISCWISDKPTSLSTDSFSFNFFEKRNK